MKSRNKTFELINKYKNIMQDYILTRLTANVIPTPNEVLILLLSKYQEGSVLSSMGKSIASVFRPNSRHHNEFAAALCKSLQDPKFDPLETINNYLREHKLKKSGDLFSLLIAYFDYYKNSFRGLHGYGNLQTLDELKTQIVIPLFLLNKKIAHEKIQLIYNSETDKTSGAINAYATEALCGINIPIHDQISLIDRLMSYVMNISVNDPKIITNIFRVISRCQVLSRDANELNGLGVNPEWKHATFVSLLSALNRTFNLIQDYSSSFYNTYYIEGTCKLLSRFNMHDTPTLQEAAFKDIIKCISKPNIDRAVIFAALEAIDENSKEKRVRNWVNSLYEKHNPENPDSVCAMLSLIKQCKIPSKYLNNILPKIISLCDSNNNAVSIWAFELLSDLDIPHKYIETINKKFVERFQNNMDDNPHGHLYAFSKYLEKNKPINLSPEHLNILTTLLLTQTDAKGDFKPNVMACLANLPLSVEVINVLTDKLLKDLQNPISSIMACHILRTFPIPEERKEEIVDCLLKQQSKLLITPTGIDFADEIYLCLSQMELPDSRRLEVINLLITHSPKNVCAMNLTISERQMVANSLLQALSEFCPPPDRYRVEHNGNKISSLTNLLVTLHKNATPEEFAALKARLERLQEQHSKNNFLSIAITSCIHQIDNEYQTKEILRKELGADITRTIRTVPLGRF